MKLIQIRNATMLLELGPHRILLDPMLGEVDSLPGFRMRGGPKRRNPLVPLPEGAMELCERATAVLITHEHPDHLDKPAVEWIGAKGLPVYASRTDVQYLLKKGLSAQVFHEGVLDMKIELIPGSHGRGLVGWLMGPVCGYYLHHPSEPSVYITGDTVLTPAVMESIGRLMPDVVIAPAGAANFGIGSDILFSLEELERLLLLAPGQVLFNHLEAIDHCPVTRQDLRERFTEAWSSGKLHLPEDGETVEITARCQQQPVMLNSTPPPVPHFQKWLTSWMN